jgi:hypothetical protein
MSAREIHDNIVVILGPDAMSYSSVQFNSIQFSSVTRDLREARFPPPSFLLHPSSFIVPPSKSEPHTTDVQRDLDDLNDLNDLNYLNDLNDLDSNQAI